MQSTRMEGPRLAAGLVRRAMSRMPSRPSVRRYLPAVAEIIERQDLLRPVLVSRVMPVTLEEPSRLKIGGETTIEGDTDRLAGATEVAIAFVTIGNRWSDAVAACFRREEAVRGLLLDEIGTAVLELLSRRVEAVVRLSARKRGLRAGSAVQPGQPGWPLTAQATLAELVEVRSAGMEVTATGMLSPVKSYSMIIGIGTGLRRWTQAEACQECSAFERCERRRSAERCA